jgi:hypothetical protein
MVLTLLSVITIHITEIKIHISYSKNHDSILVLVFHYFYVSPLPTLSLLRVHLNGMRNITIHLNVPKNNEF